MWPILAVLRSATLWVAAGIGALSIILFLLGIALGLRSHVVISGSMEPSLSTGSLIVTRTVPASDVGIGEIVTVNRTDGRGLVTHRVVTIERDGHQWMFTLQGDANDVEDPEPYRVTTAGELVAAVPHLGYVVASLREPLGIGGLAVVAVAVLCVYLWPIDRRRSSRTASPGS